VRELEDAPRAREREEVDEHLLPCLRRDGRRGLVLERVHRLATRHHHVAQRRGEGLQAAVSNLRSARARCTRATSSRKPPHRSSHRRSQHTGGARSLDVAPHSRGSAAARTVSKATKPPCRPRLRARANVLTPAIIARSSAPWARWPSRACNAM
jgi:hypothetical protein